MNSIKLDGNETILVLSPGLSFNADVSSLRSDERANVQNVSFESFFTVAINPSTDLSYVQHSSFTR